MDTTFSFICNDLVKSLCEDRQLECDNSQLKKYRKLAYEIILGAGNKRNFVFKQSAGTQCTEYVDPIEEMNIHKFELEICSKTANHELQVAELCDCINDLENVRSELSNSDFSILTFLTALRQHKSQITNDCFFLSSNNQNQADLFIKQQKNFFKSNDVHRSNFFAIQAMQNGDKYENESSDKYSQQYKSTSTKCTLFSSNIEDLCIRRKLRVINEDKKERNKPKSLVNCHPDKHGYASILSKSIVNSKESTRKLSMRWEYLGQYVLPHQHLPFLSETNSMLHLLSLDSTKSTKNCDLYIITEKNVIEDIKNMIVGVDSQSFTYDEVFKLTNNFTVDGIKPQTFYSIIVQFIEMGTCFKRLKIMIKKNPKNLKLIFDGFIFKAFCQCIDSYLWGIHNLILSIKEDSIIHLLYKVKLIRQQVIALAKFCGIHPEYKSNDFLPTGSLLLDYIYRQIIDITNSDIATLFIYILKKCCFIYFSHFGTWIFQGHLEDNFNELFIYYNDHYRPNTKYYFDRAYSVNKAIVPGFLRGYEEDILLCGKYTMLLKVFRPTHPLLNMKPPEMRICLSYNDKENLQKECLNYVVRAKSLCGNPVAVSEIYRCKKIAREKKLILVQENIKRNAEKWKVDQQDKALDDRLKKQKQLQEQIDEIKKKELSKKENEIKKYNEFQQQNNNLITEDLIAQNLKLHENVAKYQELNKMIDIKQLDTDKALNNLKRQINNQKVDSTYSEQNIEKKTENSPESDGKLKLNDDVRNFSESQKNKDRMLGSTINSYFADDYKNSNVIPNISTFTADLTSERHKNKAKVLTQEFGFDNFSCYEDKENTNKYYETIDNGYISHDVQNNNNIMASRELTELEKNRIKVLGLEYNTLVGDDRNANYMKPTIYLNLDSERNRNRRKVLESEFDILTGEAVNSYPGTPMSIDSDVLTEEVQQARETEDDFNANVLKIDTNLKYFENIPDSSAITNETPECGLLENDGFVFPDAPKRDTQPSFSGMISFQDRNLEDDENLKEFCDTMAKKEIDFFKICKNMAKDSLKETSQEIDASTLIYFIQNSVTLPLKAHMEILNNEVLKIFLRDLDILSHFESLKNYFLLMDGEFGSNICDSLFKKLEEVNKPSDLLNYHTLHSILDEALCSSSNVDSNSEALSFIVEQIPEKFDMFNPNVFSMLNLSYKVEWPLILILNPETIEQYTNIFKYLVKVRRVSWVLEKCFQLLKETHKLNGKSLVMSPEYQRVQLIRHKLSHFINVLNNYITSSALQASWENFKADLETAYSMEDLYRKHTFYIKRIRFLCLLKKQSKDFYNNIEEIFKVCLRFYKHLKSKIWRFDKTTHVYHHSKFSKMLEDESDFEKLIKYTIYLANKMINYGYQKEISDFVNVININGYYNC